MSTYFRMTRALALSCLAAAVLLEASCSRGNGAGAADSEGAAEIAGNAPGEAVAAANLVPEPADEDGDGIFRPYLLASVPERDISLFAEENGVVLQAGGKSREYEWSYMTPQAIGPELCVRDFDGDGADELAVILHIGSGTGVAVSELHLVELDDLQDYPLSEDEYRPRIERAIAELKASSAIPAAFAEENILFGSWISYDADGDELRARIGLGLSGQDQPALTHIGDLLADVQFRAGKYELTGFEFESDPAAEGNGLAESDFSDGTAELDANNGLAEPGVNHESAESPDGRYLIEAYGVNKKITAGGLYPAEGIRLVKRASGKELWSTTGYYSHSFLWSADSRYVAASYAARIWEGSIVLDARDGSEIELPGVETMRKQTKRTTTVHEARSDPYFHAEEWLDNRSLRVSFQWTGADYEDYSGDYVYDVRSRKLLEVRWHEGDTPAS
ncbi:hypothetical protein [Cohnella cellulosilytica]